LFGIEIPGEFGMKPPADLSAPHLDVEQLSSRKLRRFGTVAFIATIVS
jgi:hypothetical protein